MATLLIALGGVQGQGPDQVRLGEICEKSTADVIPLAFLNVFPEGGADGYPGINFGNACGPGFFTTPDGTQSQLLSGCTNIAEDIPRCQALGKKILLSLGGAVPDSYKVSSDESATKFADFLWGAFGPAQASSGVPRPFKDAVVDGFDFDIEHNGPGGYATMIKRLREHFQTDSSKQYYISAAPQCVLPDAQLSEVMASAAFDFIWIQFFNTPGCSARDYIAGTGKFNFDEWVAHVGSSASSQAKVFIGLPASTSAVYRPEFFLELPEVTKIVGDFKAKHPQQFGGVMLWEATASENNPVNGKSFGNAVKELLGGSTPADGVVPVVGGPPSNVLPVVDGTVPTTTCTSHGVAPPTSCPEYPPPVYGAPVVSPSPNPYSVADSTYPVTGGTRYVRRSFVA